AYTFQTSDFPFTDQDGDGETLQSVTITTLPGSGNLTLDGAAVSAGQVITAANISSGKLVFMPAAGAAGSPYTSFSFSVSDGTASSGAATESVTVLGNCGPVASNRSLSTNENTPASGTVTATDSDGDPLTFTRGSGPAHGTLTFNSNGTF